MEKYLFTDGTNVVREVQSKEELQSLIQSSADPSKVRIWIFNTNEWITLADFNKRSSKLFSPVIKTEAVAEPKEKPVAVKKKPLISGIFKKGLIGVVAVAIIFLVYNFTKVTWRKAGAISIVAERPANTPPVNTDSLIQTIENLRGIRLDKVTRTNLRIRNSWPELLQLQLTTDRDTSREGLRYYNMELTIDNATGYHIDNAVVNLDIWENGMVKHSDTLHFNHFGYAYPAKKKVEGTFKGDSISVSFNSIRSKVFNFCYSAEKRSNYGNYNDRWFCR